MESLSSVPEDVYFTKFPALPNELKLDIWDHATAADLSAPRIIQIGLKYYRYPVPEPNLGPVYKEPHLVCFSKAPALTRACIDSRNATLKDYPLVFAEILPSPILFDSTKDILFFHDYRALKNFVWRDDINGLSDIKKQGIRVLALEVTIYESESRDIASEIWKAVTELKTVEELVKLNDNLDVVNTVMTRIASWFTNFFMFWAVIEELSGREIHAKPPKLLRATRSDLEGGDTSRMGSISWDCQRRSLTVDFPLD
jgi:hypothetical protein